MRKNTMLRISGVFLMSLLLLAAEGQAVEVSTLYNKMGIVKPLREKPAPDFSLKTLDGRSVKLSQFKGKQNVLVQFYTMDFNPT